MKTLITILALTACTGHLSGAAGAGYTSPARTTPTTIGITPKGLENIRVVEMCITKKRRNPVKPGSTWAAHRLAKVTAACLLSPKSMRHTKALEKTINNQRAAEDALYEERTRRGAPEEAVELMEDDVDDVIAHAPIHAPAPDAAARPVARVLGDEEYDGEE